MTDFWGDRKLARQHLAIGNIARAYELDPTLSRQGNPSMALDAAPSSKPTLPRVGPLALARADRNLRRAEELQEFNTFLDRSFQRKHEPPPIRRGINIMKRSTGLTAALANRLFQRQRGDSGFVEPSSGLALDGARRRGRDEERSSLTTKAIDAIDRALVHVEAVRDDESKLNCDRLEDYLHEAIKIIQSIKHDRAEDDEREDEERFGPLLGDEDEDEIPNGPEGGPSSVRDRRRGRDGVSAPAVAMKRRPNAFDRVGEVPPRSVETLRRERIDRDHRRDFEGASDHAFDADMLMQRDTR